jgi:AmmeMemoRadiSam system radical SAM enzyme/AmmeMemoRadiSam system protein B/uncharacterized protein (TIGR00296 family)
MKEGDRGFCFVRKVENGLMVLDTYGKSTGFCIDPIEKKPLNHFYPGTSVLSFGTAGCNLGCQFCQNWDISKSREVAKLSSHASPDSIAVAAKHFDCHSVAFTYNDPVVWAEYAIDTAKACRAVGVSTVAVTAGYMLPESRREFYRWIDAANVDLKAFTEEFYRKITYSHLEPVLDTLRYLKHETDVWFEITNLVVPQANDSADELKRMCDWIVRELGCDIPIHFSAFHPDFRMTDRGPTPHAKLIEAHQIARQSGIRYPYVGNVHDPQRASTTCWQCGALLIARDWYEILDYRLHGNACPGCHAAQSGRFGNQAGTWGRRRQSVDMSLFQSSTSSKIAPAAGNLVRIVTSKSPRPNDGVPLPNQQTPPAPSSPSGFIESKEPLMSSSTLSPVQKLTTLKLEGLLPEPRRAIQVIAQQIVAATVLQSRLPASLMEPLGDIGDAYVYGVFTTLKRGKLLRGCCGFLGRPTPLSQALLESAQKTAREDHRMPAICKIELPYLTCDVTILSAPLPVDGPALERPHQVVIGSHGLRIFTPRDSRFGERSGLLLPSVAVDQGWNAEQFLAGVCRKAGLPELAWQDPSTRLELFEGVSIEGGFDSDFFPDPLPMDYAPGDLNSLLRLKNATIQNMIAISQGATPNYYVLDAMDGTVHGIVLTAVNTETKRPLAHWIQTSLRPGIPLQTSLFEMCKSAEQAIRHSRFDRSVDVELALTILHAPAHHGVIHEADWDGNLLKGSLAECDVRGVQPNHRAILALCGDRAAVACDASKSVSELVQQAAAMVKTRTQPIAIFSVGCVSTVQSLLATNRLGVDTNDTPRPAILANTFYPGDPTEMQSVLSEHYARSGSVASSKTLAIMAPHAGMKYSGQVAMDAWKSAEPNGTVILIGPKHTQLGADWAVSPSTAWLLPDGQSFETDLELSQRIVQSVSGMEFDAAAHAREHAIEIQLPFLQFVTEHRQSKPAQRPKIVAIEMANTNWHDLEVAAKQLASVLREIEPRPLLVVSSDMNHFMPETENRRRDELALEALRAGDPQALLECCRQHSISMCGVIPAAMVMQTLKELGEATQVESLSYDTSATSSGDTHRVVGYASARWLRADEVPQA